MVTDWLTTIADWLIGAGLPVITDGLGRFMGLL